MFPSTLHELLKQYLSGDISEEDFRQLWETLQDPAMESSWQEAIEQALNSPEARHFTDDAKRAEALERIREKIADGSAESVSIPSIPFYRRPFLRYAAAVLLIATAAVFTVRKVTAPAPVPAIAERTAPQTDKLPGSDMAVLTLADGRTIALDSVGNGQIAEQGRVQVIKAANGQLQYQAKNAAAASAARLWMNTMSTPRRGQYQLILPDGSKVWLNAESSVTYPVAFGPQERKVRITGEVYFEVARDARRPFLVETRGETIQVLGTSFNVNAYTDEGFVKTSLLEGAVKINGAILRPGQAWTNGRVIATNVEQDIAWKNGVFNFNDKDFAGVMRELARWYDLEVSYPQGIPKKEYTGEMGRNLTLNQVLKGLEDPDIRFTLTGTHLVVSQQ